MQITINTGSYNQRRMGRPWIAKVDFSASPKGEFAWGDWTGRRITASPKTPPRIFTRSCLAASSTPSAIRAMPISIFWLPKKNTPDHEALRAERVALIARIAEIDAIINQ